MFISSRDNAKPSTGYWDNLPIVWQQHNVRRTCGHVLYDLQYNIQIAQFTARYINDTPLALLSICIPPYCEETHLQSAQIWHVLARDHIVLPSTHTQTTSAFTPQPQSITALWLVLLSPSHGGMARLN